MSAKNYRKGVRTYKRLQEQLGENEPETIDVEWIHPDDPIYQSFSHPPPQTINGYNRTVRSYGSISEVDQKTIRIEMEHRWKEGHAPPLKDVTASPKTDRSSDFELMFVFGFGGAFACWLFVSVVQILVRQ